MEEGSAAGGESSAAASRVKPSFVKLGDRQIFTVELRPGETTFVSWKKLVKDANKAAADGGGAGPSATAPAALPKPPPATAHTSLESRIAPGQPAEAEAKDAAAPHRFSAVIEKIERLYMGKDSSDEEDLKDVPDDDQYDTEDSFIDDAELDEYFEVDNSAIKHDGFFVNRGMLERINEPTVVPNQQPKKRRRKDVTRSSSEGGDALVGNKHVRQVKLAALETTHGTSGSSQNLVVTDEHYNDAKPRHPSTATDDNLKKKSAEARTNSDTQSYANGSDPISLAETRDIDKLKTVNLSAKNPTNRHKDASRLSDAQHQTYQDRSTYTQSRLQSTKPINSNNETDGLFRLKEKNGVRELPDLNSYPDSKVSVPVTKATNPQRRDGSGVRPKSSMLEKSIRELEKMVAESRPPTTGNPEADASSQAVKRRLPREIKLKLAKVARLAGREGRISKELLNRLMSILGHLIQLRTLKRNMKDMISMGMRAKEEKDDRFQQIKKEVVDMIKTRVHSLESKAFDQAGGSDDFQEIGSEEKGSLKQKFSMDAVLEDKICDLYDLFVDGLDEDAGPQVRKLYVELAGLWPTGFMDNHGIKRAICRAKERRKAMYSRFKDDEKLKRKKTLTPKVEETVQVDAGSVSQPHFTQDRPAPEPAGAVLALASKSVTSATSTASRLSSPSTNAPVSDRQKPEKQRAISNNPTEEAKMGTVTEVALAKKKVKRKPEQELDERTDKLHSRSSEERHKSPKHASGTDKLHSQSS